MFKIRQLLSLYADGRGSKFISKTTGIARNTIKKYLLQFVKLRLTIERVEAMSDRQLATAFLTQITHYQYQKDTQRLLSSSKVRQTMPVFFY